jgi:hypothetical protein
MLMHVSLSAGFGLGIFSVTFFLARVCSITNLLRLDLSVFGILLAACVTLRTRPATTFPPSQPDLVLPPWLSRVLFGAFPIALCAALYSAVMRILAHPHGDGWDAFAIWNLHARFLFRGGPHWRDGFTPLLPWSHPDYPLLLPAATAHFWTYLGSDAPIVPALISLLFAFSTVGFLYSALALLRGRTLAMLGTMALLTTPFFIQQATSQYADVPVSFFVLATVALLALRDESSGDAPHSFRLSILAGLATGFAAWTKNEGLLFLCAILLARLLLLLPRNHRSRAPSGLLPFAAAVSPAFLLVLWFKHFIALPGDLFSDRATTLQRLLQPSRYWAVLKWYAKDFLRFGHWLLVPGTLLVIALYVALYVALSRGRARQPNPGFRSSVLVPSVLAPSVVALALTLAGYFAVYLITPYDIYWHLRFSLDRLFLQLWPAAIFLCMLALPRGATVSATVSK